MNAGGTGFGAAAIAEYVRTAPAGAVKRDA
jgi:hypothetical protein